MRAVFSCGCSRRNVPSITMATAPIGRLTQNTTDQLACSTRKAPRVGPTIAETPNTLDSSPCTLARSAGV